MLDAYSYIILRRNYLKSKVFGPYLIGVGIENLGIIFPGMPISIVEIFIGVATGTYAIPFDHHRLDL
jgi:hypothetical protein